MAQEVFNRYEHKYKLDKDTFQKVIPIIEEHMEPDCHNKYHLPYTIANIYYDTDDNLLIRNSLASPLYKEKLRLRSYGIPDRDAIVFLEIKKKFNGIVNKRRTKISLSDAEDFVKTGVITENRGFMNTQVIKEISYFLKLYDIKPKLYLSYDRIAYFEINNPDLRISFDFNIRSRRQNLTLYSDEFTTPLFNEEIYIMEIKTSFSKPLWFTQMLSMFNIKRCRFSKYGTEYKNFINNKKAM